MIHRILLAMFLSVTVLEGCTNSSKNNGFNNPNECTQYACPMHRDKTSTVPKQCSECGMDMTPVKTENDSSKTDKDEE